MAGGAGGTVPVLGSFSINGSAFGQGGKGGDPVSAGNWNSGANGSGGYLILEW